MITLLSDMKLRMHQRILKANAFVGILSRKKRTANLFEKSGSGPAA